MATPVLQTAEPLTTMDGRGDKRTTKGKRSAKSFGKVRRFSLESSSGGLTEVVVETEQASQGPWQSRHTSGIRRCLGSADLLSQHDGGGFFHASSLIHRDFLSCNKWNARKSATWKDFDLQIRLTRISHRMMYLHFNTYIHGQSTGRRNSSQKMAQSSAFQQLGIVTFFNKSWLDSPGRNQEGGQ